MTALSPACAATPPYDDVSIPHKPKETLSSQVYLGHGVYFSSKK